MSAPAAEVRLAHGRIEVALHPLRAAPGEGAAPPLLLLHELGGSAEDWRAAPPAWPGAVFALDFAGHGRSGHLSGGGYYEELFVADADVALAHVGGRAAVAGAGIGAYVALLLAGARTADVRAALLLTGRGLAGAGSTPALQDWADRSLEDWEARLQAAESDLAPGTDPMVSSCETHFRPDDYVADFAEAARRILLAGEPESEPSWWTVAGGAPRTKRVDEADAFAQLREAAG